MYIIAEPVTEEQLQQIQSRNKSKIEEFERSILGLHKPTDEGVPTAKSVEEDTSDWKDIHAKVEEELSRDELSSEPTSTQSSEPATIGVVLNDDGSEGPPDGASLPHSGTLLAQRSPDETSEHSAMATVDDLDEEVDDEEEDNADKDDEVDAEEESGEEGQEDGKTGGAGEGNEENTSGTIEEEGRVHDLSEGDVAKNTVGEIAAGETPSTEDISKVSNSDGAQEAPDVEQAITPSDVAAKGKKQADGKAVNTSPLLAMALTVRNKVNGKFIDRPQHLDRSDKWTVEYSLAEIPSAARAWSLYGACQNRRKKKLDDDDDVNEEDVAKNYYLRSIREMSEEGRRWRQQQDRIESKTAAVVLDRPSPSARSHADGSSE